MQQVQKKIDRKNARTWAFLSATVITLLTVILALFIWSNFGAGRLPVIIVGGIGVTVVIASFPAFVGWTNRNFSFGGGIWSAFIIASIIFLAIGGWINFGSEYIKGEIATSSYITIQFGKGESISYILHPDGEFGIVNAQSRFQAIGKIGGNTILVNGVVYPIWGFEFVVKSTVVAVGAQPFLLIEFVP